MKKLKKFILPFTILFFEGYLYYQMTIESTGLIEKSFSIKTFILILILVNCIGMFLYYTIKKNITIEKKYLWFSLLIGILYMFIIPVFNGTDELGHFFRSYEVSSGNYFIKDYKSDKTIIPKDIENFYGLNMYERYNIKNSFKPINYKDTKEMHDFDFIPHQYSPISYLPQMLGFKVAKIFRLSPLFTFYCVRLFNLLSWVFLTYFAIKLLPNKKTFAFVLLISPAFLSLMSTSSVDTFTNATIILFCCYIFNLIKTKRKTNYKDIIFLVLSSIIISAFKSIYILIIILSLLIPKECFKNKKQKYLILLSIIVFVIILYYIYLNMTSSATGIMGASNESKQLTFILNNPIKYIYICLNTFLSDPYYYLTNFVAGSEMCYQKIRLIPTFVILYFLVLIMSFFDDKYQCKLKLYQKIIVWFIILLIVIASSTAMYLSWTSLYEGIGTNIITGIQSRYFFVLVIPLIMTFSNKKKSIDSNKLLIFILSLSMLLAVNTFKSILVTTHLF